MMVNTRYVALAAIISTLANALPLDTTKPRVVVPRAKSYSVINVDGGASTAADATTIVEETTKTVQVTNPGPTITAEITATVVEPVPAPAATSTISTSQSSSSRPAPTSTSTTTTIPASASIETPKPVFVTVTITDDDGPTEYYDSGMWHTSYRIKSFEAMASTSLLSTLSSIAPASTGLPAL